MMRGNSHVVPAYHHSLDLFSPPTTLVIPFSFPLFLLLFPLPAVVSRLTSGSPPPATSDSELRRHVTYADDTTVSMETDYVTDDPGDDLRRDLGVRLLQNDDPGEGDGERHLPQSRDQTVDLDSNDLQHFDLEKDDLERRHHVKHGTSTDHLENRDIRRHDLEEEHDLEKGYDLEVEPDLQRHLTRDKSVHHGIGNLRRNIDLHSTDLDLDHGNDLDLENASRSTETLHIVNDTSASSIPDRHAYHRPFNSLKLPVASHDVTTTSRRHHQNATRYRLVFHHQSRSSSSSGDDVAGGSSNVNLMIIPLGAIFVFIVIFVLHVSRWCIEDIREADGMHAKRHLGPGFISSGAPPRPLPTMGRSSLPAIERIAVGCGTGRTGSSANSETDLARLHTRARMTQRNQTRIVPARSTRSLNGIRDRNSERANRKLAAVGSDSSIPMTEMTSAVRCLRHAERGRATSSADDGIVETCKRAVGSFLQSHLIVVPVVDRNHTGTGSGPNTRTRNYSSPASSSKTGSSCSESRPLLAHCSSSSDGRMTSSDSNIDVMSPLSVRRRLAGETRYRTKPSCVNSAGNLLHANRIVQHGGRLHPVGGRAMVGYSHQSSAPAVSKLVHDSLNLSFRFFQVPLCSGSSSAKDSLDSVFVCGIYADDPPIVATPTSAGGGDALRPDTEVIYGGHTMTSACKPRHQPRPSKERAPFHSHFDRQSSIGEEVKMVRESSLTLNEGPEVDFVQPEVTQQTNGGCHGDRGANFRRARSANELQVLSVRDKRSGKCLTT